jgi:cytochrome P450
MLNAEETAGDTTVSNGNGECPHMSAPAPRPTQDTVAEWVRTHDSEAGLPPGPGMSSVMQTLGIWSRPTAFLERCRARYGTPFTLHIRVPPTPFVMLADPESIKEMFQAPADVLWAGEGSSSIEKYTGQTGLACLDEDKHLARRRLVNRSMQGETIQRAHADIAAIAERDVASWPRGEIIELYPWIHRLTLKVVFRVVFGPEPDRRLDELLDVVMGMMDINTKPTSVVPVHTLSPRAQRVLTAFKPTGIGRFQELSARADELIYDVLEERRRNGAEGEDMVALMLAGTDENGEPLELVEIRDELVTNFVAGTTTTAATIAWAVEHLTREHEVRERLVEEIKAGEGDAYLTATVHEILRRRPPLPTSIPRLVVKPIEIGGREYKPGVHLWGSPYLLHHDASVYPDPYAFRPERFLDKAPGTYTWIPFGGGRRRCLGRAIADLEIKCVLREILGNYEVRRESPRPERVRAKLVTATPARNTRVALTPA